MNPLRYAVLRSVGLNLFKLKLILEIHNVSADHGSDHIEAEPNKLIASCVAVLLSDHLLYIDTC